MSKRFVVWRTQLPTTPARYIWHAAVIWLLMDRFDTPGWLQGAVMTLLGIVYLGAILAARDEVERHVTFAEPPK